MNELRQWGGHPVVHRLGWTLLHFLWQGVVTAGLFAVAYIRQRKCSSNVRYGTGCVALLLMLAAPVVTFVVLGPEQTMPVALTIQSNPQLNPARSPTFSQTRDVLVPNVQRGTAAPLPVEISSIAPVAPAMNSEKFILDLVLAWLLGVSALTLRLLFASLHVARLKRRGSEPLDASWMERLDRLKAALQISRPVRLVKSALVEVPAVVGWLRPVILLPAATWAGLTPAQLESILAHELAHVRRHDYLVNLLQNALETLLFYHPAVWWVSSCVRAEREICCDEIAVQLCGDRLVYAKALTTLEQLRGGHSSLALGVDGGSLLERIRRLSGAPVGGNFPNRRRAGGVLIAALVAIIIVFVLHHPSTNAKARESTASPDLTGTVRGPANQPITNAAVSIYAATPNVDGIESRSSDDCQKHAMTDATGKFTIKALDANAHFRVLIVAKGFRPMFCYGVDPSMKTLDVTLKPVSSGALPEEQVRGRVVGPDGKPVSSALVNVYGAHRAKEGWREPAWEDIDNPVFTDDAGEFVIHGQSPFISCDLSVEASGFAQSGRYTEVSTGAAVHEFRLAKGAALKGRLLKDGKPVANAGIGLSIVKTDVIDREFSVATDSEGRFSFVNIPPNREYYLFGIMRSLKERGALSARRVRLEGDGSSLDMGDLNLEPGFTLSGVLRLANGQPAPANWTMTLWRTVMTPPPAGEPIPTGPGSREFLGLEDEFDNWTGKIGKDGHFHFSGVPAETVSLGFMVTSPYILSPRNASRDGRGYRLLGRMTTNKTNLVIEFEPRTSQVTPGPVDYQVLSQKPLRGIEAGEKSPATTNQETAPAGPLNPSKPNLNQSGNAGQATNRPGVWTVSGSVVDAETRQPIAEFTITPGMGPDPDLLLWQRKITQHGQNGRYHIELGGLRMNHYSIMAEAPGYLPEMVSWGALGGPTNGIATRDFALRKGEGFSAQVVGLDGRAVAGAQVAYSLQWGGLQLDGHKIITYTNQGEFLYPGWQRSPVLNTDAQGHFTIPGMPGIQSLIIFHQDGFAQIPRETLDQARVIHLQPWTNAAGVANEKGLKVRLNASKTAWTAGTVPELTGGIRNEGAAKILSSTDMRLWRIEMDGKWYRLSLLAGPLSEIKADQNWSNVRVSLDAQWHEVASEGFDMMGEAMYGQSDVWNDIMSAVPLTFSVGKHIIRLAVFAVEAAPETVGTIEAVSNPVEIEMAAPPAPAVERKSPVPASSSKPVTNSLGLTLEIRCTTNVLKVGDEIPIEFLISNHGTEDYKYTDRNYDRSGRMGEYKLVAKTASGENVPDPRQHFKPGMAGGLAPLRLLHPGESFSKVIALNLWALIKEPGRYEVVGIYGYDPGYDPGYGKSDPISITVLPRTKEEMRDYIQGLTNNVGPPGMSEDLVKKLMYTCSPESISTLLSILCQPNAGNGNERFWATAALADYVPHTEETRKTILKAATKYGLNGTGLEQVLLAHEFDNKQMKPIIERALAADHPGEWRPGVWLALRYYDAAFSERLIAIAGDSNARGDTRSIAMKVLSSNRTDAGVKAIKALLKDPAPEMLRPLFETIANGYSGQGTATNGRPLQAEDFSAEDLRPLIERLLASTNQALALQLSGVTLAKQFGSDALTAQLVALSTNPSPYISGGAVYALALNRTDEGVKMLKTLLSNPDPKISKLAEAAIRNAYISRGDARGRPLRADDFDAKFREPEATPAK